MKDNSKTRLTAKKATIIIAIAITFTIILPIVEAQERVIVNSADWRDVYSGVLYGKLTGKQSNFLTSTRHATILTHAIPRTDSLEIISSRNNPFVVGYPSLLAGEGYASVEELRVANANRELLELLPGIERFIVLDDSYGYNAVSVAPLAVLGNYYVIFANSNNINQIANILEDRTVREIIIYGHVDREVPNTLQQYNPEIINTGDRFENNMVIVDKYQELYRSIHGTPRRQAILTNGEFIEASIMNGADPVLFIGFANVPEHVREYIEQSDLEVGTLVGNELIGTATFIRRQTGLSVFVKFGQGARVPAGPIAQVEDLDRFPIPRYELALSIAAAMVNTATNNLEVVYRNAAPIATYFMPISIVLRDDTNTIVLPMESPATFIDRNDFKTMLYPLEDADGERIILEGDNKELDITVVYGESPRALEQTLEATVPIEEVSIIDGAEIDIVDVAYAPQGSRFLVRIKNVGPVDAYVSVEMHDIDVDGELFIFGSDETIRISPGRTGTLTVETTMTDEDIPNNERVRVRAYYGERENALIKVKEGIFDFKYARANYLVYVLVILIILLLLLFFVRKKCKNCGEKNPYGRKKCKKCGHKL